VGEERKVEGSREGGGRGTWGKLSGELFKHLKS